MTGTTTTKLVPFTVATLILTLALITDAVIIYIMYFVSGQVGNTYPWTLTSVVTGLWLLRLALAADNKTALLVGSLALSASGYFLEGAFSALGLFTYNHVDFFYCPLWLAAIYLHGGFALVEGAPCLRTSVPHQKLT
ncbi:hypothetical protein PVAR5_2075 [Paecilomyces variotii No. 5]|uniref:Uncharacterized protein n=1 Tax=Byssochlamys spectabilis (strain No. 5 / NBRC 109023) TaxID=1356009 RepID=V5HUZ0_BYSSN|nr:hypothetical protein PVAR5_2075 [Paecilomyces variotii No. 5]